MENEEKPTLISKAKKFYNECIRVLTVTKKPDKFEYQTVVKVSGIGIIIIGAIGFLITMIKQVLLG